jgi:low affinity Fe/Cu permease
MLCIALAAIGVTAYLSGDELFISGANISISIVTLLLLPILQATQNRDGAALQAKIDELIAATAKARDDLIGLENRSEQDIEQIRLDEGQRAKATGKNRRIRPTSPRATSAKRTRPKR